MSESMLSLNCWVLGDRPGEVFTVKILQSDNVSVLKDIINTKMKSPFPATKLELWRTSVVVDPRFKENIQNLIANKEPLAALEELSAIFPGRILNRHVHIVIKPPSVNTNTASSSDYLSLNCWVLGDPLEKMFTIEIPRTKNVSILKRMIKENVNSFSNLDAKELDLWKVSLRLDNLETDWSNLELEHYTHLASPAKKLSNLFNEIVDEELHIVVKRPPDIKRVSSPDHLSLNCLVLGDSPGEMFNVKILQSDNVSMLKRMIKGEMEFSFPVTKIELWKVSLRLDNLETDWSNLELEHYTHLASPATKLSNLFNEIVDEELHIVVKRPPVVHPEWQESHILTLNCFVLGQDANNIFRVELASTKTISDLKDAIKTKMEFPFPAAKLELWRTSVAVDSRFKENIQNSIANKEPLAALKELSAIFPGRTTNEHVHIVVKPSSVDQDALTPLLTARCEAKKNRKAPSTTGQPMEFSKVQNDPKTYLACTRPPNREPNLPLTLLDPVFAKFTDDCRTVKPTEKAYECARRLKMDMNRFYSDEAIRGHVLRECLMIGGFEIVTRYVAGSQCSTDGHILCNSRPTIILELKNEIGSSGAEPSLQALLYYELFTNEYKLFNDVSSIHSCLVITLVGPRLAFAGCVLTERCTLETFSSVAIDFHNSNNEAYDNLARHLTALKTALDTLSDRYSKAGPVAKSSLDSAKVLSSGLEYPSLDVTPPPYVSRIFPYPTAFTPLAYNVDGSLSFIYVAELEERSFLFKGETKDRQSICVKFVRRYGKDAHIWCAEQGFAPKLIGFEKLSGGWFMVVMELLDESWITLSDAMEHPEELKAKIKAAVVALHQHGMVHGDIRSTNVMVKKSNMQEFMIIDYDWAGVVAKVNYPQFINTDPTLGRPADVRYDVPILTQHDIIMVENIFSY